MVAALPTAIFLSILIELNGVHSAPFMWMIPGLVYVLATFPAITALLARWTRAPFLWGGCAFGVAATTPLVVWMTSRWLVRLLPLLTFPHVAVDLDPPGGAFGLFVLLFALGMSVAALLYARGRSRVTAWLIRGLALLATAALLALIGPAAAGAWRLPAAPEASSLKTVLVIDPVGSPAGPSGLAARVDGDKGTKETRYGLGEIAFEQRCSLVGCTIHLDDRALPRLSPGADGEPVQAQMLGERFEVQRGADDDVLYLRSPVDWRRDAVFVDGACGTDVFRCAFRRRSGGWVKTDERPEWGVFRRVRPAQMVIVSAVGLALVLFAWGARLRSSRQRRTLDMERWEACVLLIACHALAPLIAIARVL